MDYFHNWFMNAYEILSHSGNDSGLIPLSELKCYEENFGLIGSFKEFVSIIYSVSDSYSEYRAKKTNPVKQTEIKN